MFYLIGDIHGNFGKLFNLYTTMVKQAVPEDIFIFLGDYIDRGGHSYEVIEFLLHLAKKHSAVFLKGNHEGMFMDYLSGKDIQGGFLLNGGEATIRSYVRNIGGFSVPGHHRLFLNTLKLYYEGDDFIAVHAGLNPSVEVLERQEEHDLLWIRDKFFRTEKRFKKTVIFGHTPTVYINGETSIYDDPERNIIGIDTGVIFGRNITCLRWPDRKVFISGDVV